MCMEKLVQHLMIMQVNDTCAGFYLAQKFWGGNKRGILDEWAALAAQGGGCGRGMCPLPCKAREAKANY